MKTTNVKTWLPLFSGFYETIWNGDGDEEYELENINDQRKEKGLDPVEWDDVDWNYEGYQSEVVSGVTDSVGNELKSLKLIKAFKLEKLSSPREYNYTNDSIHVTMTITPANVKAIKAYLDKHSKAFEAYLKDRYTSYDGFCSSYSNRLSDWFNDFNSVVTDTHKLGSVLEFILRHDDQLREHEIYEKLSGDGVTLRATNYRTLIGGK